MTATANSRLTLYWLNNDLRLHDNPALTLAATAECLVVVYCINPLWLRADKAGTVRLGEHRLKWLQGNLASFDRQLRQLGQRLIVVWGDPASKIAKAASDLGADRVIGSDMVGWEEQQQWARLKLALPHVRIDKVSSNTLYSDSQIEAKLASGFPASYSQFRKRLNDVSFRPPSGTISHLPKLPDQFPEGLSSAEYQAAGEPNDDRIGEAAALKHLSCYLGNGHVESYKETRNQLEGEHYASAFSLWLANGSLSVCKVAKELASYESRNGSNLGTTWLRYELLWREYFYWYARHYGSKLFRFSGITGRNPLTSFYPERFKRWTQGNTPWPLVNACMACLNTTGLLSNRGRQIVASALVNELAVDWRYGAAWFEQQLLDYDVSSNWGNWQYIAGVGSRGGGCHFDLEEQTRRFDPDHRFTGRWVIPLPGGAIDSVDAADWPISQA